VSESTYKGYRISWYQRPPPYDCEAEIRKDGEHIDTTDTLVKARALIDELEGTPPEAPERETREIKWRGTKYDILTRDSQKERLYRAEREAFDGAQDMLPGGLAEAQRYANSVVKSATWKRLRTERGFSEPFPLNLSRLTRERKRKGIVEIEMGRAHCTATAYPGKWLIKLPTWAHSKHVVLHELAHIICGSGVGHHWTFARAFEDLVSRFMGREQAKKLRAAYRKHGVKRAPPREMTEEAKAALAARGLAALTAWKAAKSAKETK
jgi:putative metallohydrolase (TIGR04338 family)